MPKSRKRPKVKARKVYTHSNKRQRKEGNSPVTMDSLLFDQLHSVIDHSKEIIKLKIEKNYLRNIIAMCARNRDNMSHFIFEYKEHIVWINNKIQEHSKACSIKMKLFLGNNAKEYLIPEDFHLGSTDLKNGYVALQKDNKELTAVILDKTALKHIIPHDEEHLKKLDLKSLLKNEDIITTILSRKVSDLEPTRQKIDKSQICVSVSCMERKPPIKFEDL